MKDSPGSVWFNYKGNPHRFADTEEAQAFLDTVQYKSEIEWVQAPELFRQLNEVGAPLTNWREIINAVEEDFKREVAADEEVFRRAESFERRGALLQVFKSVMDIGESRLAGEDLEKFRGAREHHYKVLLTRESLVDDNVCVETMYQVTTREIEAGRMPPDFSTRQIAEQGMAVPHLTRDELLRGDAAKLREAAQVQPAPEPQGILQRAARYLRRPFASAEQRERERRKSLGYD
ncbi:MAG: hypothetical protein LC114_23180 [Bryobacterales bacterium]|nr:hypothetical protein [Bryobacterales bacterium]